MENNPQIPEKKKRKFQKLRKSSAQVFLGDFQCGAWYSQGGPTNEGPAATAPAKRCHLRSKHEGDHLDFQTGHTWRWDARD